VTPRHPARLALAAMAFGVAGYALFRVSAPWLDALDGLDGPLGAHDLLGVVTFLVGALVPSWIFRRFLVSAPLGATVPAALLGLVFGCIAASGFLLVLGLFEGVVIEELEDVEGWLPVRVALLWLIGTVGMMSVLLRTWFLALPIAWLGIVAMRRAGGVESEPAIVRSRD
jgi:hypothetical protein